MGDYLQTSESDDVLCSVRHCSQSLKRVTEDAAEWEWVILSLHSALQGAMVCHLTGTTGLGALSDGCVRAHLEWHERDRRAEIYRKDGDRGELGIPIKIIVRKSDLPPDDFIADFKTLLRRISREDKMVGRAGSPIHIGHDEMRAALLLNNRLRRRMTHFSPGLWAIPLTGLPAMVHVCAGILLKIAADPWPFRHMEGTSRSAMLRELAELRRMAVELEKIYNRSVGTT